MLTAIAKTQTYTTFNEQAGTLGTSTRPATTTVAYGGSVVKTITDAEGRVTSFAPDGSDRRIVRRPLTVTGYGFTAVDPYARVESVWRAHDAATAIEQRTTWDTMYPVEPASVTDNYGALLGTPARTTSYIYIASSLGLLSKLVEPLSATTNRWTEYVYNTFNDVTQVVVSLDGSGTHRTATRYCYNTTASCPNADGHTVLAEITGYVDGVGGSGAGLDDADTDVRTTHTYDGFGQRETATRHNRDAAGTLLDQRQDRFEYDGTGNLTKEIANYANGTVTSPGDDITPNATTLARTDLTHAHTYDTAGCTSGSQKRTLTRTYDALGRAIYAEVTAGPGSGDVPLDDAYDAVGNRRSAAVNGGTPTTSTLNLLDQVVAEARSDGSTAKTTFDPAGNPVDQCSWASGATVGVCLPAGTPSWPNPPTQVTSSAYDARNQRVSLEDPDVGSVTTYDPDHNYAPSAVYRATGSGREHQTLHTYDARHRLIGIVYRTCAANASHACTDTPVANGSVAYAHDDNDNRTQVNESNAATSSNRYYCYDARNQLAFRNTGSACSPSVSDEAWTYDAAGNRLTATTGGVRTNFAYHADGRLCDVEIHPTAALCSGGNVSYDSAGRTASRAGWHYAYDAEGRLVSACKHATCAAGHDKVTMAYDADGNRSQLVTTTAGGTTTTTTFRHADGTLAEETEGDVTRQFVTDASGSISKLIVAGGDDPGTYLVNWNGHGDALNLVRVNGDGTTTLANSFTYDTWGTPTTDTHNSIGDLGFRYLYVGQFGVVWDNAFGLGLHHMGARHYSPVLGRFLQPDPAALEANAYFYAGSNPVSRIDPSGNCWWCLAPILIPWIVDTVSKVGAWVAARAPTIQAFANGVAQRLYQWFGWAATQHQRFRSYVLSAWSQTARISNSAASWLSRKPQFLDRIYRVPKHQFLKAGLSSSATRDAITYALQYNAWRMPMNGLYSVSLRVATSSMGMMNLCVRGTVISGVVYVGSAFLRTYSC